MDEARVIKIYGLPRSCTNVATVALRQNFKVTVLTNTPCWKHGENEIRDRTVDFVTDKGKRIASQDVAFVVGVKHPVDWLLSLWSYQVNGPGKRKWYQWPLSFEAFLKRPAWHYRGRGFTAFDVFNKVLPNWLALNDSPRNFQLFKQEEMENHQLDLLARTQREFQLALRNDAIRPAEKRVKPGEKLGSSVFRKRTELRDVLSDRLLRHIQNGLDPDVVRRIGYDLSVLSD